MHSMNVPVSSVSTGTVATACEVLVSSFDVVGFVAVLVLVMSHVWAQVKLGTFVNSSISPVNFPSAGIYV